MPPIYTPPTTPYRPPRVGARSGPLSPAVRALANALATGAGMVNPLAGAAISGVAAAMDVDSNGIQGGAGVTNQLDRSVQFVAKKRKGSKGKKRKAKAQLLSLYPKQTLLRNSSITGITASPTANTAMRITSNTLVKNFFILLLFVLWRDAIQVL